MKRKQVIRDKALPHQIILLYANSTRQCLNGETARHGQVVVTCNCHPKGTYMGLALTTDIAWAIYNAPMFHNNERKKFRP